MRFDEMKFTEEHIYCGHREYDRKLIERIIEISSDPKKKFLVIDGFCGMGGVTEGFARIPEYQVIACINHWDVAIETHQKNFPDCLHLLEDFKTADLTIIKYMIAEIKKRNPGIKKILWLSLECTNFSNAKGGQSRDADSRTLADHADRYVVELEPDIIWIENVKEFKLWGRMIQKVISMVGNKKKPIYIEKGVDEMEYYNLLINNGHIISCPLLVDKKSGTLDQWMVPDPNFKGEDFDRWKEHIASFGYTPDEKTLNCADFGIPQHRVRLIMQFTRKGVAARWPGKTHDKKQKGGLLPWNPVRPCLDLDDEGDSVLAFRTRKGKLVPRITSPKTIIRLMGGIDRFAVPGAKSFDWLVKYNSAKNNTDVNNGASLEASSPAITCVSTLGIAKAYLIDHYFGNGYVKPVSEPAGTTGCKDGASLHTVQFLSTYHSQGVGQSVDRPSDAIMSKDKNPLVTTHFMNHDFSDGQQNKSIDETSGALLQVPKQKLVSVEHFLMDTQFNNGSVNIDNTMRTLTANRKHYYLINFQWCNANLTDVDRPSNTVIARQDKAPSYLITLETGELAIEVFEHDPPHYVALKKFMADRGIVAINMRMLKEVEMLRIMTINEETKLSKSSTNNKKMIGNAVPSDLVELLGEAWLEEAA